MANRDSTANGDGPNCVHLGASRQETGPISGPAVVLHIMQFAPPGVQFVPKSFSARPFPP
jgi:hypothetical protein